MATVKTDPVIPGNAATALTWQYTYDNDNLAKVCDPDNNCTHYAYTWVSQHANATQNIGPYSYWRLSEPVGSTIAASSMQANAGVDNAVYNNVALGQAPPRKPANIVGISIAWRSEGHWGRSLFFTYGSTAR